MAEKLSQASIGQYLGPTASILDPDTQASGCEGDVFFLRSELPADLQALIEACSKQKDPMLIQVIATWEGDEMRI